MLVFFASRFTSPHPNCRSNEILQSGRSVPGASGNRLGLELVMGIEMKKVALLATALAMVDGFGFRGRHAGEGSEGPAVVAFDPWDVAFGAAIMSDYIFRGVTQSNHKPSVAAYFEPRYNVNKDLQLYVGVSAESISFPIAPLLKSTSTAVSARPSAPSPSTSVSGATCIRAEAASVAWAPRRAFPAAASAIRRARSAFRSRQRHEEGRQLLSKSMPR